MGAVSIIWYVVLTLVSQNILADSIAATGLAIALLLGITGVGCVVYYRRELLKIAADFLIAGLGSALGAIMLGYVLVKSCIDLANRRTRSPAQSWLGIGAPLAIGILSLLVLGIVLMIAAVASRRPTSSGGRSRRPMPGVEGMSADPSSSATTARASANAALAKTAEGRQGSRSSVVAVFGLRDPARGPGRGLTFATRSTGWGARTRAGRQRTSTRRDVRDLAPRRSSPRRRAPPGRATRWAPVIVVGTEGENPLTGAILGSVVLRLRAPVADSAARRTRHAARVTETSSLRSSPPFSVCSSTVPMPRT